MRFATIVLNTVGGIIELLLIIICANSLGIVHKNRINKIRIVLSLMTYITISAFDFFLIDTAGKPIGFFSIMLYFVRLIITICVLHGCVTRQIVYLVAFLDLSISLISSSVSCIVTNVVCDTCNYILPLITLIIQITTLILTLLVKKKNNNQRNMHIFDIIPNHTFIMIIVAIICLSALSSLIGFQTDNRIRKENTLIAIVIMLTVILICIVISLFLNVIAKQHFTAISQMMEKQVELQINHYDELEKLDAEISRFRHDYTNHLRSILSLVRMNEYSQAEEYIEKLQKVEYKSGMTMFYTGNKLADAIFSEKSATLDEGCRIEYSGIIPQSIENVDLCIILSNALDNAIEACCALQSQYTISIFAGKQQGYFVLSINNPTVCSENFHEIPPTTKLNKEQHGMGLYNIESVVKKYDGQMKIQCENGVFELMITMKI